MQKGLSGTYTQFVYLPDGTQLAVYSGALVKGTISLPGGATAVYNGSGLNFIRHKDWLGSSRLATTWAHAVFSKEAYAPFGETYNEAGAPDRSFTGQDQNVVTGPAGTGVYDFLFRKYDPSAGRWLSPDPYGWNAVDQTTPQSLNRYAYVMNNPMTLIDPSGLDCTSPGDDPGCGADGDWSSYADDGSGGATNSVSGYSNPIPADFTFYMEGWAPYPQSISVYVIDRRWMGWLFPDSPYPYPGIGNGGNGNGGGTGGGGTPNNFPNGHVSQDELRVPRPNDKKCNHNAKIRGVQTLGCIATFLFNPVAGAICQTVTTTQTAIDMNDDGCTDNAQNIDMSRWVEATY